MRHRSPAMTPHAPLLVLLLGATLAAQDLGALERQFDKKLEEAHRRVLRDKLAALEAYVDGAGEAEDLPRARLAAAQLALELEEYELAKNQALALLQKDEKGPLARDARLAAGRAMVRLNAAADAVFSTVMPAIETARLEDQASIGPALEIAQLMSGYLANAGDKLGAKEVWSQVERKLPHDQIKGMVASEHQNIERIGTEPKGFAAKDLDGKELKLEDYKGKVLLIDFWATWCQPCVMELPNVRRVHERLRAQGFEILGISLDRDRQKLTQFLQTQALPWRQVFDLEQKDKLAELYGIESIPSTWLLGRDGKIARVGARGDDLLVAASALVAKKP